MTDISETLITMLHTDPETFADGPSDSQIIEGNPDLRKSGKQTLSKGEREGFLEMWRVARVQDEFVNLPPEELERIVSDYDLQAEELRITEARIFDMRFLANAARSRLAQASTSVVQLQAVEQVKEL
jgi:hypothetical protein